MQADTTLSNTPSSAELALESPSCVLCGEVAFRELFAATDRRYRIPGEFKLVECGSCGLRYVRPRPQPSSIGRYYPDDYPAHQRKVGIDRPSALTRFFSRLWDGYQRLFLSRAYPTFFFRKHTARFRPADRPPRVLDIGCGSGSKLAYLREAGWDVFGVDFSEAAVANARASGLSQVYVAPGDALPLTDGQVDAVYSWHSLEHHYDPVATLREAFRVLRTGGRAIFAVPASDSLGLRIFRKYWGPLEIPRHLYHFTERTLSRAGQLAGFTRVATFYDFSFYGLFLDQEILESLENLAAERGLRFRFPRPRGLSVAARIPVLPFNWLLGPLWRGGNLIVHFEKR